MKILLTLLLSFYFLSCGTDSNSEPQTLNEVPSKDSNVTESVDVEPVFTITNTASDGEEVIVFLQTKLNAKDYLGNRRDELKPYILKPNKCVQATANQFNSLAIMAGMGYGHPNLQILCGDDKNKCKPQHHEIIDDKDLGLFHDYEIKHVKEANTKVTCANVQS